MHEILTLVLTSVITFFTYEVLRAFVDKMKGKKRR